MSKLKGIKVVLHLKTQDGVDGFNRPIYIDTTKEVDNVLIGEPSTDDITNELNLTGKKLAYTLGIPKGDTNVWTDTVVEFFGDKFRTFGEPTQGIEAMIPLEWNKKVKVERYG
jgi:hypothetical protein